MTYQKIKYVMCLCIITGALLFLFIQFQRVYVQKRVHQQYSHPVQTQLPNTRVYGSGPTHTYLKSLPVEMIPDLLNPGNFLKPDKTPAAMETAFIKWIMQVQIECSDKRRLVNENDGGWDVCFDPPFQMTPNSCLVYSFGISKDWTFDDDISKTYNYNVHSFDPSIGQSDHNRSDKISFNGLGLTGSMNGSGSGYLFYTHSKADSHPDWKLDTLNGIKRTLGHQNKLIDYLKMDIERSEFSALPAMFQDGDLLMVKQLGIEVHIKDTYYNPKKLGWIYLQLL